MISFKHCEVKVPVAQLRKYQCNLRRKTSFFR